MYRTCRSACFSDMKVRWMLVEALARPASGIHRIHRSSAIFAPMAVQSGEVGATKSVALGEL